MSLNDDSMDGEYSIALFEDGTKEMIPKSWIQDYLKEESEANAECKETNESEPYTTQAANDMNSGSYTPHQQYCIAVDAQSFKNIKKSLQEIAKDVADNKNAIGHLQKSIDRLICIATGEPEPEVNLSQPAETLNEFLAIEEHIKVKFNYDDLVLSLSKIGGKTVESTTRKVWNRLCTTQLASSICWTGANGKYCLKTMALNRLVRDTVLLTHPQGKETDIQRATMLWFSHAQDRLRGRKTGGC